MVAVSRITEMEADVPFISQGYISQRSSPTPLERMEQSSIQRFFPQVPESQKSRKGQEFETWEDAFEFYNAYAKQAGFNVRKDGGKKKKGTLYVPRKEKRTCVMSEKRKNYPEVLNLRRRGRTCYCKAKINVVRNKHNAFYRVSIFTEDHSHPLSTPEKLYFLRSHRKISSVAENLVEAANVPTSQQLRLMEKQTYGLKIWGVLRKIS